MLFFAVNLADFRLLEAYHLYLYGIAARNVWHIIKSEYRTAKLRPYIRSIGSKEYASVIDIPRLGELSVAVVLVKNRRVAHKCLTAFVSFSWQL